MNTSGYTNRNGRPWRYEVVLKMLQNEFYLGYVTTGRKDLKKSNFEKLKGAHDAIIEEELYAKVNKRIIGMKKTSRTRKAGAEQLFSGIAVCPICSSKLYYIEAKNYYKGNPYITPIYRCGASNPNRGKCTGFSLSLRKVDDYVMNRLKWLVDQDAVEIITKAASVSDAKAENTEKINSIEMQLQDTIKARNKYFDLFESGKVEINAFADRINDLLMKIDSLKNEKQVIEKEMNLERLDASEVLKGVKSFLDIYDDLTPQERREVIRTLITEVILTKDKTISEIRFSGGFSI
jgi:hypothetical protein